MRQRDPTIFTGEDDTDAEDWLSSYERVSAYNKWNDPTKLHNVFYALDKLARRWYANNESDISTWSAFRTRFVAGADYFSYCNPVDYNPVESRALLLLLSNPVDYFSY